MPFKTTRALFFQKFPSMEYAMPEEPDNSKTVTNILSAFTLKSTPSTKTLVFQKYTLTDKDIPESLAEDLYGDFQKYWTILIVNSMVNPFLEWAMPTYTVDDFVEKKYKDGIQFEKKDGTVWTLPLSKGINGIHHFINVDQDNEIFDQADDLEIRSKYFVNPVLVGENVVPVTNKQYEEQKNFARRPVIVVNPENALDFVNSYNRMIRGKI